MPPTPDTAPPQGPLDPALPVAVDLCDADLAADVTAFVEAHLGWQVVAPSAALPPRLLLADRVDPAVPTAVVLRRPSAAAVQAAVRAGAVDVIGWPVDRDRLAATVPSGAPDRPAHAVLVVAAASGGVGASTVALALGAHLAWAGRQVVVRTDHAGARLAAHPGALAGVTGLRVLAGARAATDVDVLVVDRGVGGRGHVLVGRPDRALLIALAESPPSTAVVVVGEGAMRPAELARALGGRRHAVVATSFRAARAGLRGLVPAALPGRLLADLAPLATVAAVGPASPTRRVAA